MFGAGQDNSTYNATVTTVLERLKLQSKFFFLTDDSNGERSNILGITSLRGPKVAK